MNLPKKKYLDIEDADLNGMISNKQSRIHTLRFMDKSDIKQLADELENISELTYYQRDGEEAVTKNLVRPALLEIIKFLRGE
jgi:hypothetical protein